jgi:predicted TIM-barrel fold metal-dependent hydrolase
MADVESIRAQLDHPVIDADGHWLEYWPIVGAFMKKVGGDAAARATAIGGKSVRRSLAMTVEARRRRNVPQEAFWGAPTRNTRDRATAMMPKLLYGRLDEIGIDFAVMYPTGGLGIPRVHDDEARIAGSKAFNTYCAEAFAPYADRMTPAAVIPMHSPDEAIEALEHAVGELGLKAVYMNSLIERPIEEPVDDMVANGGYWFDVLGLDSAYDYDPVWAKCRELNVSPSFHKGSRGRALRISPSNFTYNHIGHFAAAGEAVCKALFLGGVTRRFPDLNFGFLEGGVGFACLLYADLIGHWHVRSSEGLEYTKPSNLDVVLLEELAEKYGGSEMADAIKAGHGIATASGPETTGQLDELDDYARCGVSSEEDIKSLFVDRFYFGCEADDPSNAWAFNANNNPLGARLNAIYGSDIGHFDVRDMNDVLPEAYELVEDGNISRQDFADFVCNNAVRFWGETNPEFFAGTTVAATAASVLTS